MSGKSEVPVDAQELYGKGIMSEIKGAFSLLVYFVPTVTGSNKRYCISA